MGLGIHLHEINHLPAVLATLILPPSHWLQHFNVNMNQIASQSLDLHASWESSYPTLNLQATLLKRITRCLCTQTLDAAHLTNSHIIITVSMK